MPTIELEKRVKMIEESPLYRRPLAFGLGLRRSRKGKTLDVLFPHLNFQENFTSAALLSDILAKDLHYKNGYVPVDLCALNDVWDCFEHLHHEVEKHPNVALIKTLIQNPRSISSYHDQDLIAFFMYSHEAIASTEEAFFKLQLLSQRKTKPHTLNLDGLFGKLHNLAWTTQGPFFPEEVAAVCLEARLKAEPFHVSHVDKFPYILDYHVPTGVRIASGSQVRLGAYLGEGSTVMQAGFVNFNAGTEGNAMIEGRVSAGVVVGNNSDVGGGASIMGTLSGGNNLVISIGDQCLLGANSGTGISLGFGCTIAAGLYIYAGLKVSLYDDQNRPINADGNLVAEGENIVKAKVLSGRDHMLFLQDSVSGRIVCKPNLKTIKLNPELHKNG